MEHHLSWLSFFSCMLLWVLLGDLSITDLIWLFSSNPYLPQEWWTIPTCPAPWGFFTSPFLMSRHNRNQLLKATSHNRGQLLWDGGCHNRDQTYPGVRPRATQPQGPDITCCGKTIFVLQPKTWHPRMDAPFITRNQNWDLCYDSYSCCQLSWKPSQHCR